MPTYACTTTVSVEKTKVEIERILKRYGANAFVNSGYREQAMIQFLLRGRVLRFVITLPSKSDPVFERIPKSQQLRDPEAQEAIWQQAIRQRWRALQLIIKAKLEAIDAAITTLDEEFLGWIVLPDGATVGQRMIPQVAEAYKFPMLTSSRTDRATLR